VEDGSDEADPFSEEDTDALAVAESDGSASLRAKPKLVALPAHAVLARVVAVDDQSFPRCVVLARVLKTPARKEGPLRLLGRGRRYRFAPRLKLGAAGEPDLTLPAVRAALGACYYPPGTTLEITVSGVDLKQKLFSMSAIRPR
jgi:hypothetical protein